MTGSSVIQRREVTVFFQASRKPDRHTLTVLVVAEDKNRLRSIELELGGEYPVLGASCKRDTLRIAENARPDAIVLDTTVSQNKNGLMTFYELKRNPETCNIPVVILLSTHDGANIAVDVERMKQMSGHTSVICFDSSVRASNGLINETRRAINSGVNGVMPQSVQQTL